MTRFGIFFGTDTGRTRLVAKQIAKKLQLRFPGGVDAAVNAVGQRRLRGLAVRNADRG